MGLSLGYQMAMVLHSGSTNQRVQVVSGTSKEGAWKDMNASSLPHMFKKQREIFAKQIEEERALLGNGNSVQRWMSVVWTSTKQSLAVS